MPQPHISISLLQTYSVRTLEQGAKEQDATAKLIQELKERNLLDPDEVEVVLVCLRLCFSVYCFSMCVCVRSRSLHVCFVWHMNLPTNVRRHTRTHTV
jgi:hypothetical protein